MRALEIRVRGVVQGVGFRPYVYRLAQEHGLRGWVSNQEDGVEIHVQGAEDAIEVFLQQLPANAPLAAQIAALEKRETEVAAVADFVIRDSRRAGAPSVRISPDLRVCDECLAELLDPSDPRYRYPYINCTNCGPRFSVIESLPYDRAGTTMRHWPMDELCARQYGDPYDRRFHAQPVACPNCGPHYRLEASEATAGHDESSIEAAAAMLREGRILAIKGIGGYHLSCDASNVDAVQALRERKFRKEKPFAVMVWDLDAARRLVELSADAEKLLLSSARPIVLAPALRKLAGVAPGNHELGVMLAYAPPHHLLFAAGAPQILVMTSANRSSEPIAYRDDEAHERLVGLADCFLIGERPIARRVDDSVARAGAFGPSILRRSRGYAPGAVTTMPATHPILAVGADLKNTITLVVQGQAFVSQHVGDLDHYEALAAFKETIQDFVDMYGVNWDELTIVHDLHPQYLSTLHALDLPGRAHHAVQHHQAHIASVLAEKQAWETPAVGVSFDGTGYGDDGSIWGGEFFVGSLAQGWTRALHLRNALLPGGDAAARWPVQCAAGFLSQIDNLPNLTDPPFSFSSRYSAAAEMIGKNVRTFPSSSVGRLFDTVAALLGFTHEITFEGQAAIWLEQLGREGRQATNAYPFPIINCQLDFRPMLTEVVRDRCAGRDPRDIARDFHDTLAAAIANSAKVLCEQANANLVALSGGVFQNELLLAEILSQLDGSGLTLWTNNSVPVNDGGISLGQAACVAFVRHDPGVG